MAIKNKYSTKVYKKIFSSTFDGTEDPLSEGGAWTSIGDQIVKSEGQASLSASGGDKFGICYLNGIFSSDQYARIKITSNPIVSAHEVGVRCSNLQGYVFSCYIGTSWRIYRYDNITDYTITSGSESFAINDIIEIYIIGSNIIVSKNGTQIAAIVDTIFTSGGTPSFGFYTGDTYTTTGDNFECGEIYRIPIKTKYPTRIYKKIFSSTFDGTESPLSENGAWDNPSTLPSLAKSNGQVISSIADTDTCAQVVGTFTSDQYVQFRVTSLDATGSISPALRINGEAGYFCALSTVGIVYWARSSLGAWTELGTTFFSPVVGDIIKLEIEGTGADATLKVYQNGIFRGQYNDSDSFLYTGNPGLTSYGSLTYTADNFECGEIYRVKPKLQSNL